MLVRRRRANLLDRGHVRNLKCTPKKASDPIIQASDLETRVHASFKKLPFFFFLLTAGLLVKGKGLETSS